MKKHTSLILAALASGAALTGILHAQEPAGMALKTGDEPRVDNWVDAWMIAQRGPAGKAVQGGYLARHEILDTTDAKQGLFSVSFTVGNPATEGAWGFFAGPYLTHWALAKDFTLQGWVKASAEPTAGGWRIAVYDTAGRKADSVIAGMAADGKWREIKLPLASLKAEAGFDPGSVRSVQVEAALPQGARLWLDDVRFQRPGEALGVSDKTVTQYMAEAAATRAKRVAETLSNAGAGFFGCQWIAPLYKGENLEAANNMIVEWTKTADEGPNATWTLWPNSTVNWLYFGFGSKGRIAKGRITPETEKILLDYYWKHCELKNDIATARQSTWWVTGSENHDINFKMANLLSSQIFMGEPNYAKRIYPDLGRMQGYGFGEGSTFRVGAVSEKPKLGSGNYKDGKSYNAADHYKEWVPFWKEFLAERARHGFFIEHNAASYMLHTLRFLHEIYAWSDDAELRQSARMFHDLIWAQWAQDQTLSITGGACTRGAPGWTRLGRMAEYLLGGPGDFGHIYCFSDYQWPREIWEMALGRSTMGEYAYVSPKPNEAQGVWPQPPGTEYTMIVRPDSRLVRHSWSTPDYVMGTRMDHPDALYQHLSESNEGIIYSTSPGATVHWTPGGPHMAVQHRSVALIQAKKSVRAQNPPWFPGHADPALPMQVSFGPDLDRIEEQDGWVFVQEGNAYTALRVVSPAADTIEKSASGPGRVLPAAMGFDENGVGLLKPEPAPYTWLQTVPPPNRALVAKDVNAALIVESSRRAHHATLEEFKKDVLDNPLQIKQVIGSGFILTYKGSGSEAKELELNCSSQAPAKIDGKPMPYTCPTFDSPWLQGAAGSGVITLTGPISGHKTVLDFNKITVTEP